MRVMVIEDDYAIGSAIRDHIAAAGHGVDWARNVATATDLRAVAEYDLFLIDLGLPDGSGMDQIDRIRGAGLDAAVIIISARSNVADRVAGLNAGADDYLVKPFDLSELDARISAIARRINARPAPELQIGRLRINLSLKRILRDDVPVDLTAREWTVLERLIRRDHETVSRTAIEEALYDLGSDIESNTVEVYISRLRKKLGKGAITTVRGLGYQMTRGES